MNKLGYTEKQIGRMTFGKWTRMYQAYQNVYDMEFLMKKYGVTYARLQEKAQPAEEIIAF